MTQKMNFAKKLTFFLTLSSLVFTSQSCHEDILLNAPNELIVILKADDLGETSANWNRFIQAVINDSINASIGIIPHKVKTIGSISEIQRVSNLKLSDNTTPVIDFWVHGYDHSMNGKIAEFQTNDKNYQIDHIRKAQKFFSDTLHISNNSFGAPYNNTTTNTYLSLKNFPEIKIWMCFQSVEKQFHTDWKDPNMQVIRNTDKYLLLNVTYTSLSKLSTSEIINNFERDKKRAYVLIQIHPAGWNDATFEDFEELVYFYKMKGAVFMTPNQYYNYLQNKNN
jgi:hypothetical protein